MAASRTTARSRSKSSSGPRIWRRHCAPRLGVWSKGGGVFGQLSKVAHKGGLVPLIGNGLQIQYLVHEEDLGRAMAGWCKDEAKWPASPVVLTHEEPLTMKGIVQTLSHKSHSSRPSRPVRCFGLRCAESLGLKLSFRSDSLVGLLHPNLQPDFFHPANSWSPASPVSRRESEMKAALSRYERPLEYLLLGLGWSSLAAVMIGAVVLRLAGSLICRSPIPIPGAIRLRPFPWIEGKGFVQMHGRGWFYPPFVRGVCGFGSFGSLAVVQQILGLLSGVFFYSHLAVVGQTVESDLCGSGGLASGFGRRSCGPSGNPQTILFEVQIRPEAIMNAVVFAQLFCVLQYVHARWRGGSTRAIILWGAVGIALAYAAFELKPSWAPGRSHYLPAHGSGHDQTMETLRIPDCHGGSWCRGHAAVFSGFRKKPFSAMDIASQTFLPMVLFALHADLINADMHQNFPVVTDKDKEFMAIFDQELANATKARPQLRDSRF